MKKLIIVVILTIAAQKSFGQIPFEVMVGNKQTMYFGYIQKDLDSTGKWNIFSQGIFAVNYRDSSYNNISIDNQLTYQLNNWIGISAGGSFDGKKFIPSLGLSLSYINKKGDFFVTAFPTVQFDKLKTLDLFALINYSPQFNNKWGLFSQLIIGSNYGVQKEYPEQSRDVLGLFTHHNISNQLLRVGINYKQKFQVGVGADFAQFGIVSVPKFDNYGIFLRYQIE